MDFTRSSRKTLSLLRKLGDSLTHTTDEVVNKTARTTRAVYDKQHTLGIKRELETLQMSSSNVLAFSQPFCEEEVVIAIKYVKSCKALGFDGIHPEFLIHARKNCS